MSDEDKAVKCNYCDICHEKLVWCAWAYSLTHKDGIEICEDCLGQMKEMFE